MCGRYVMSASTDELIEEFAVQQAFGDDVPPSWNVAPTQRVRVVLSRAGHDEAATGDAIRQLRTVRWGLVPHWAKDPAIGARMINARSETVAVKPSFQASAARRRCLVPADGYYEWTRHGSHKTPYFLHDPDGARLAMAGLYAIWRDPGRDDEDPDRLLWTCTVITRAAPDTLGHIHDRSPVLVPPAMHEDWLDCSDGAAERADALLAQIPPPHLEPRQVSPAVGNVRNDSPELIAPVAEAPLF